MIISDIQKVYEKLTPTERKIAAYVFSSPEKVVQMSAAQVAENCGAAHSAITRFCKAIGQNSYAEFKMALAKEIGFQQNVNTVKLPDFDQGEETERVVRKVFNSGIQTLQNTLNMLDFKQIETIAEVLRKARRVFIFGVGTSAIVAQDAQYRFSQLGLWATACTDILVMNVTAANLGTKDVILAISHSGRTKAVVDAVRHAKKTKASTLAITSFTDSLLAKVCDQTIVVHADENRYPVEAVSARMAHIGIMDALMMVLATGNYDDFTEHVKIRNKILNEIRYKN